MRRVLVLVLGLCAMQVVAADALADMPRGVAALENPEWPHRALLQVSLSSMGLSGSGGMTGSGSGMMNPPACAEGFTGVDCNPCTLLTLFVAPE